MKKFIYIIITIVICLSAQAQQYYSKMFDVNGQWEDFSAVVDTSNKSYILLGLQVAFLVNDSSKFQSLFIGGLDSNFVFHQKLLIAKNYQSINYMTHYKNNNENYLITSTLDSNLAVNYILNELSKTFDTIKWNKKLTIPTDFYSQAWLKTKDKIYCFGRNGQYSLSAIPGFYAINLKDTSTQYYRIGGTGKIINNVVLAKDGNFIVNGLQYQGTNGNDSAFGWYAKIDTLGNTIWNKLLDRKSTLMCSDVWGTNGNGEIYLTGSNYANYPVDWYPLVYGDTSFSYIIKINDVNGTIVWQKRFLITVNETRGLQSGIGGMVYYKNNLYGLISHNLTSTNNQYIMFAKFDLQGNILWKRLFQQANYSNRSYSLTPVADGFLICADGKDSTRAKGDSDAWLIKTDTNGCIIPGCNAKDGIVQIINPEKVFTVYPNPAQNEINVELNFDKLNYQYIESLAIYNMQGQVLKTVSKTTTINTEDLANGNYLLIITTNKQQMAGKKFVVER